jgi:hypothetical protein
MLEKINRRTFVTTTLCGLGGMTFSSEVSSLLQNPNVRSLNRNAKKLIATTDYVDNIINNDRGTRYGIPVVRSSDYYENHRCFMDRKQLDGLHKFLASVGVTRHQWMVNTTWTLYEDYPHGFDLLEEATKSAHKYGLEFYAVIKPFEGGGGSILPHSMPCPDGIAYKDLRGIIPIARPFVAAHPDMNLKRRTGTYEWTEPLSAIRLVKNDDEPTRIKARHLSIWTSPSNNGFVPYTGPVSFRETIEPRNKFPYWKQCRILHLEDLKIPGDHRYILIRCAFADGKGDFSNEKGNILELAGANGKVLPNTLSTGPVNLDEHEESFYQSGVMRQLIRYLQKPEVLAEINDRQKMKEHYHNFYSFGDYNLTTLMTLDKDGYVAAACGKPEYMYGNLHPVYPEVKEHFLDLTGFCLDRGVDGINFRVANHILSPESWEYGFNEPAIMASGGKTDYPTISKINGDAYTLFLREARELIEKRRKKMVIHLNSDMLFLDDRPGKLTALPYNFEWQWETWVKEIADELEFRGIFKLRPWHLQQALDIFSHATRKAGKPFYLQGDFHGMTFDGPFARTEAEINLVKNHDGLDGYVFYETANVTEINEKGELEGSREIADILKKQFSGK